MLYEKQETNTACSDRAEKIVSEMNTDEKIGQTLMIAFRQWNNDSSSKDLQNVTRAKFGPAIPAAMETIFGK